MSLTETRLWALAAVAVSYWANVARTAGHDALADPVALLRAVVDNGAFPLAAWLLVAVRARRAAAPGLATGAQVAIALAAAVLCLVPARQATIGALAVLGGVWLAQRRPSRDGRRLALTLLALAFAMLWQSIYADPFHILVAMGDARITGLLLRATGLAASVHGNIVDNIPAGFGIVVFTACTSSYSLAEVPLAFLVTRWYLETPTGKPALRWFAASVLASIALTEIRLRLMAGGRPEYLWWHDGSGSDLYGLFAVALAVLFPLLADRAARRGALPPTPPQARA